MTLAAWPLDTVQDQLARRVCRNGARHEPLDERACMSRAWLRERFVTVQKSGTMLTATRYQLAWLTPIG